MKRLIFTGVLIVLVYSGYAQKYIANYEIAKESILRSIPEEVINQARNDFHIVYWHTSHGTHVNYGMYGLQDYKAGDDVLFAITNNDPTNNKLDFHNIYGKDLSVQEKTFDDITRDYLDDPANADINVVMWSWCDIRGHEPATYYLPHMQDLIDEYGEGGSKIGTGDGQREKPVKFIFMTGHAVANDNLGDGKPKNQADIINSFCEEHHYLCLDYYSIDSHDMDDRYWEDVSDDAESADYKEATGDSISNFYKAYQYSHVLGEDYYENKSAPNGNIDFGRHLSQHITANRKAYAMWWILARLTGWGDTPTSSVNNDEKNTEILFNQSTRQLSIRVNNVLSSNRQVVRVYNLTGVICLEKEIENSSISLAHLPKGIYIVSLSGGMKRAIATKILIQ